ncbi:hypothetical protein RRF57_003357 [Xylaria bambusicola]|uniref:Uncharacterized protein n=1 Tax=Xylaria bambusicola TaxID=326684 RepID=A0AAN7UGE7_9PEZI
MDSLATYGEGHIDPIVDEQWNVVFLRDGMQFACCLDQQPCVACLVSVLHAGNAAPQCRLNDLTDVLVAENGGRRVRY